MKLRHPIILGLFCLNLVPVCLVAQDTHSIKEPLPLFRSDEILPLTLTINKSALWADRGDDPQYHSGVLSLADNDGKPIMLPANVRSRGHFRKDKTVCRYAPLLLNLEGDDRKKNTVFADQNKLKLVMPCASDDLVEREYLVYKVYNLLTPFSLRARLVKILVVDSANPKKTEEIEGFLLEPPEQAALRNGLQPLKKMGLSPEFLVPSDFNLMAVFQFFVANTDWSVQYLHNIELATAITNGSPTPLAYDFDHAGLVNAPYALPAAELELESVKERRYRGFCIESMETLQPIFALFNKQRNAIETLYRDDPRLSAAYRKWSLDFINKFYTTINNPKAASTAFTYPCKPGGTGAVIIRGLKN
ncbi:hypothetical protein [Flavihumibacter fluvii]|uniref:hypothetical protein n=1 Tax=Flavihumibacter fluvii TaxID=2838157 RepID=UPI001BDDF061|nr:hypothetical protein [Flavihumibacter fluvii]ULQ51890.1 hypothetical protein KJS93_17515 [Flavihumibacter fluvii]